MPVAFEAPLVWDAGDPSITSVLYELVLKKT